MKKPVVALLAAMLVVMPSSPALAGWKLIEQTEAVTVAKSNLEVTPPSNWNRWTSRPVKESETWTKDGVNLNELYFIGGLPAGKTLYKDSQKKDRPLPQLSKDLDLTEIPEFYESSTRLVLNTSVFEMTSVEPGKLAGYDAVKFEFQYSVEGSPLLRKGLGVGTMVGGELFLVAFTAPSTYFFERDRAEVEAIMASATL
ncbi:hypothetical protein INR77_05260 [Erythrobacter sp. SCSIO 43205]|uniref:hypothetical protein n=1 Tax=Erythrobacter sp. SCSIO 43205 TaxID=2779361 RepID=UPI001CA9307A|nr:hypothetical protein [Erythrobacter sp. SCSIO 43205]UAB79099.1 hypothetical protein INR77_05260 [Erythrobacter sp. SCSIO 43205]